MRRKNFIISRIIIVMTAAVFICIFPLNVESYSKDMKKHTLKFKNNKTFKIVQFADIHERAISNKKTINLMNKILDYEKPDLVVLSGDNTEYCNYLNDNNIKAVSKIVQPMEKRNIPWAVVLGNHDTEGNDEYRKTMMQYYESYNYNFNNRLNNYSDVSDYNIFIMDSKGIKPVFNIYMLDSNSYAQGGKGYGSIKTNQIEWYKKSSDDMVRKYGKKIPSLMFFHIPLKQWKDAWRMQKICGERNEEECPQGNDTGLFSALLEKADTIGVFTGHDHTNDYVAKLNGIILGYGRCTGYNAYGENFARGARVFLLNEENLLEFKTWVRLESDF